MKFVGKVIRGKQIGSKFGIATANLEVENDLDLEEGVYFVLVRNKVLQNTSSGALFYGSKKTFGGERTIEVHILDLEENLYDQELEIEILKRTRDVEKFKNAEELFTQIKIDIIKTRKFFIRRDIFEKWGKISNNDLISMTESLNKKCVQHKKFQETKRVFVYAPTGFEIHFVEKMCKNFPDKKYFFPKVIEDKLEFYESKFDDLQKGKFGLLEPVSGKSELPNKEDLVFVPALAVDKGLNRLGRGGGYYDRFLKDTQAWKVSVIPEFAYVSKIPTEKHDVRIDEVIVMSS